MKIKLEHIIIAILATLLTFSLYKCDGRNTQISQLQLENQQLDNTVNKYGQIILQQEAIVTDDKLALKLLTDSLFNLKKAQDRKIKDVIAYYKGITKISIVETEVPYLDTTGRKAWEDSVEAKCRNVIEYYEANTITVPKTAHDSTANYVATLTARKSGIQINNITFIDSQYIRFVTLKGGLLKRNQQGKLRLFLKPTVQVQVLHTNALIKVTGQNSAIYIAPKKANLLGKAFLIGAGVFIGTKLNL